MTTDDFPPELPPRPKVPPVKPRTITPRLESPLHPLLSSSPTSPLPSQYHGLTYQTRKKAPPQTTSVSGLSSNVQSHLDEGKNVQQRLRDQSLKAQLQELGLTPGMAGWEMVFSLANGGSREDKYALDKLWNCLKGGQVTLLLSTEQHPSSETTSLNFLLDHCLLSHENFDLDASFKGKDREGTLVTLSGFKGGILNKSLVLSSCGNGPQTVSCDSVASTSKLPDYTDHSYQKLLLGPSSSSLSSHYPSFNILSTKTHLAIPRSRSPTNLTPKKAASLPAFSRLFGRAPSTSVLSPQGDEGGSEMKEHDENQSGSSGQEKGGVVLVPAMVIDASVKRKNVMKGIGRGLQASLRAQLKDILGGVGGRGEKATIDRVCRFAARLHPPPDLTKDSSWTEEGTEMEETTGNSEVNVGNATTDFGFLSTSSTSNDPHMCNVHVEDISTAMQDMYSTVRDELESIVISKGIVKSAEGKLEARKELAGQGGGQTKVEEVVDEALKRIEDVLCVEIYDRIFSPPLPMSSDSGVDETLASKIAALSILDLGLEHLGIDLDSGRWTEDEFEAARVRSGLEEIAKGCGHELAKLQDANCKSPSAKLEVLVNVHRVIVDGLSALPPIQLKDEKAETKSISSTRPPNEEVEMDDARSIGGGIEGRKETISDALPHIKLPDKDVTSTPSKEDGPHFTDPSNDHSTESISLPKDKEKPSTSSADLILPILIFSVVQNNPKMLVSNLLYIQRFHADYLMRGEAAYCSVNLSAVADFLENVDMEVLGLVTNKVMSPGSSLSLPSSIRGKVTHHVDDMVGSASKVLSGVVDTSFKMLFSPGAIGPRTLDDVKSVLQGGGSIAANSLRVPRSVLRRASTPGAPLNQTEIETTTSSETRLRSRSEAPFGRVIPDERMATAASALASLFGGNSSGLKKGDEDDRRSIISVSSIISSGSNVPEKVGGEDAKVHEKEKLSIQDRLATLAREKIHHSPSSSVSKPSSLHNVFVPDVTTSTSPPSITTDSATEESKKWGQGEQPIERFLTCEAGDLRLDEVAVLLKDYKRLAALLKASQTQSQ